MQNYNGVSRFFHWSIAALILGLIFVGFYMDEMNSSPLKFEIYGWHKSLGITVLALAALRVVWRVLKKVPKSLDSHQKWEKILSKTIHGVLYLFIFIMPLSGWVMSSAGGHPVNLFGLFELPPITEKDPNISRLARSVHEFAGYGVIGAVGLHIVGALKHHFVDKDTTLNRMGGRPVFAFLGIAVLILTLGVLARQEIIKMQNESVEVVQPEAGSN